MKRDCDKITIETREELRDVIIALDTYMDDHPQSECIRNVKRMYNLLDCMDMEW